MQRAQGVCIALRGGECLRWESMSGCDGLSKGVAHAVIVDARRSESTWASSDGGPGLNRGAHIAGRSIFGTKDGAVNVAAVGHPEGANQETLLWVVQGRARRFRL